ncbi:hypothetical protein QTP88_025416 [Uroleucon formosanum]
MLPRSKVKTNSGTGLLNTVINSLPIELHLPGYQYCGPGTNLKKRLALGQSGINGLDSACREHDIAYDKSNSLSERSVADSILEERAWSRVGARDADYKEKAAAWLVTTGMKAKRKIGAGCGFSNIVGVCKKALKNSLKSCPGTSNMSSLIKSTVRVARKHVKSTAGGRSKKNKNKLPRIIKVPQTGGSLSLIPILAGLSALGTLAGGVANIVRTIRGIRSNNGSQMKYEINSTEVQRVKKPGITSAMKGYCSYSPVDENILQNAAWDITNKNANFMKDDTFSGCIPLKHVFGFCEDYKRILVNCSQQLILNRSMSDTSALHYTSVVGGDMATDSVQTLVKKVKV